MKFVSTALLRSMKPWGFAVVENSLWEGVPNYLRELNEQLEANLGYQLPVDFVPVRFTSWMGGDRDGNPNVTADHRHVLLLSRWKATDLFLKIFRCLSRAVDGRIN